MQVLKLCTPNAFSEPVVLDDKWLSSHNAHSIGWSTRTVFNGKKGTKYKECRCYTCRSIAWEKIQDVTQVISKAKTKKKSIKCIRRANEPIIYPKGWSK